jgi:hypothetical protein
MVWFTRLDRMSSGNLGLLSLCVEWKKTTGCFQDTNEQITTDDLGLVPLSVG